MSVIMQKIDEYELRRYGNRSLQLGIPKVFTNDNQLEENRNVAVFRASVFGVDAIIITPVKYADKIQQNQSKNLLEE